MDDMYFDYCLYPYIPPIETHNKIKSINILLHAAQLFSYNQAFFDLVDCIKKSIGNDRTVYGIKQKGNDIIFEFYFYNYYKRNNLVTMTHLKKIFQQFFCIDSNINEHIGYFMVSVDINQEVLSNHISSGFHIYIPASEKREGGYSYLASDNNYILENHYEFFNVLNEKQIIIRKIKNSVFIDPRINLREVLIPELFNCWRICVAKKRTCDCIYFSRITVEQLLFFLQRFGYPSGLVTFVRKHKNKLNHLLYDVGFDYYTKEGKIIIEKSGFYGIF
jgi:hypothetical protein